MGGPSPMPVGPALPPAQLEGWELLVGPLTGKSILCLSDRALLVAALAQRCAHACVVSPPRSPGTGSTLPGGEWAWHNVEIVTHDALQARIQSNGLARFDGLVFSRPRVTATPGHVAELPDLLRSIRPALRDGAFVLVVVPNRLGLTSDRVRAGFRSAEAWSSRALLDLVRGMGTSAPTIHPMLIDAEGRISEVLAPTGYRATKNVSLTRERIKQWFWGPRSAHWFAPALACVGWIGPPRPTVIDSVARALARGDGLLHWVQYLVLRSGKVIATFARSRQAGNPHTLQQDVFAGVVDADGGRRASGRGHARPAGDQPSGA